MQKKKRGGKRKGAGRPKTKEDTKVMRVPLSKVERVKTILSFQGEEFELKVIKK